MRGDAKELTCYVKPLGHKYERGWRVISAWIVVVLEGELPMYAMQESMRIAKCFEGLSVLELQFSSTVVLATAAKPVVLTMGKNQCMPSLFCNKQSVVCSSAI